MQLQSNSSLLLLCFVGLAFITRMKVLSAPAFEQELNLKKKQQNFYADIEQQIQAMTGGINDLIDKVHSDSSLEISIASDTSGQGLSQEDIVRELERIQFQEQQLAQEKQKKDVLAKIEDVKDTTTALVKDRQEKGKQAKDEAALSLQTKIDDFLEVLNQQLQLLDSLKKQQGQVSKREQKWQEDGSLYHLPYGTGQPEYADGTQPGVEVQQLGQMPLQDYMLHQGKTPQLQMPYSLKKHTYGLITTHLIGSEK